MEKEKRPESWREIVRAMRERPDLRPECKPEKKPKRKSPSRLEEWRSCHRSLWGEW